MNAPKVYQMFQGFKEAFITKYSVSDNQVFLAYAVARGEFCSLNSENASLWVSNTTKRNHASSKEYTKAANAWLFSLPPIPDHEAIRLGRYSCAIVTHR